LSVGAFFAGALIGRTIRVRNLARAARGIFRTMIPTGSNGCSTLGRVDRWIEQVKSKNE
jgi:hypothetical protein